MLLPASPFAPVAPVFATAKENFLLIVMPSTVTGMVASQDEVMTAVVVNVIVGDAVPLSVTAAVMPVGQMIDFTSTTTTGH